MKAQNNLTVTIEIKDKSGRVIGRKEVARYAGLLAKAHDEGLKRISTSLVQVPNKENGLVAIVSAHVVTSKGRFCGIGDASPQNVRVGIAPHLIRMAETRAKARALRDAVNIGVVSMEELGDLVDDELSCEGAPQPNAGDNGNQDQHAASGSPSSQSRAPSGAHASDAKGAAPRESAPATAPPPGTPGFQQVMSEAQRRMLFRLAAQHGVKPEEAQPWLEQQGGGTALKQLSRNDASRLIDKLQALKGANGAAAGQGGGA